MSVPSEQREVGASVSAEEIEERRTAFRKKSHAFVSTTGLVERFEKNPDIGEFAKGLALLRAEALVQTFKQEHDIIVFDENIRGDQPAMRALKESPELSAEAQRLIGLIGGSDLADRGRQAAVPSEPQLEPPNRAAVPRPRRGPKSSSIDR